MEKLKRLKVELWKKEQYLNEIGQPVGIKYAFLSPKAAGYKQCHPWIKCRDFLQDAVRMFVTRKKETIYGFNYKRDDNPPIDFDKMRMLVKRKAANSEKNPSEKTREIIDRGLDMIHCIEKHGGIKPLTNLFGVIGQKDLYVFIGSKEWMESTFMISLYTFLIRLGAKDIVFKGKKDLDANLADLSKSKKFACDHDISYLKDVYPFIHKIVEQRKNLRYIINGKPVIFKNMNIDRFHNYTGIVSLCKEASGNPTGVPDLEPLAKFIAKK